MISVLSQYCFWAWSIHAGISRPATLGAHDGRWRMQCQDFVASRVERTNLTTLLAGARGRSIDVTFAHRMHSTSRLSEIARGIRNAVPPQRGHTSGATVVPPALGHPGQMIDALTLRFWVGGMDQ